MSSILDEIGALLLDESELPLLDQDIVSMAGRLQVAITASIPGATIIAQRPTATVTAQQPEVTISAD